MKKQELSTNHCYSLTQCFIFTFNYVYLLYGALRQFSDILLLPFKCCVLPTLHTNYTCEQ